MGKQLPVQWTTSYLLSYQDCLHLPAAARLQHRDQKDQSNSSGESETTSDPVTTRRAKRARETDADKPWYASLGRSWFSTHRRWDKEDPCKVFRIGYSPSQKIWRTWRHMCPQIPLKESSNSEGDASKVETDDRFLRDQEIRIRMIENHRDEDLSRRWDALADEDHTHHLTAQEYLHFKSKCSLHSNKQGSNTLLWRHRSDFKHALSTLQRLQQEAGEEPHVLAYSYKHQQWEARSSSSTWWNWQGSWWTPPLLLLHLPALPPALQLP